MAERAEQADRVVPVEVSGLLEERSKIRGWMERLVELKEETTPAVFERVREDYDSRLADVGLRLSTHREELEGSLATHREKVDGLQAERDERAAELEEAKLRFTVGEYDDAEWSRRRESCEAELGRLDGRLEEERGAVKELAGVLEALLADGAPPSGGGSTEVLPAAATAAAEAGEDDSVEAREYDRVEAPEAGAPEASGAGTLEVPEAGAPEAPEAGAPEAPEAGPLAVPEAGGSDGEKDREQHADEGVEDEVEPVPSDEAEFLDELEFLESLSLDDAERFDAVSAMLEGEPEEEGRDDAKEGRR